MTRFVELLVFSRPARKLAVLLPLGALGWLAIGEVSSALAVVLVVVGLAAIGALIAWMTGWIARLR